MLASRVAFRSARVGSPRILPTAARGYAAPAGASADSKPPVALFGLDGTYASALYTAAAKTSALDTVSKALTNMSATFKSDKRLANIMSAPTLSAEDKKSIVAELQKAVGAQDTKEQTLGNFLNTLAENNRLSVLEGVCEKFETLMSAARGELEMRIVSASPLDAKVVKQLETAVGKSQLAQGKKLKVLPQVNPDIRGGLIVEVGDRTIDLSVVGKMNRMNKLLQETL